MLTLKIDKTSPSSLCRECGTNLAVAIVMMSDGTMTTACQSCSDVLEGQETGHFEALDWELLAELSATDESQSVEDEEREFFFGATPNTNQSLGW